MKRLPIRTLVALMCSAAMCESAVALPPPPSAPLTLWNFLGIPQGLNKIRDATSNRRGNFPGAERKPPMKALADPENMKSPVSAIKKAAEIKSEEDLAPQKIKAVKYLSTVGCGCYGGVKEALLESLDDCTEEVRYQTVLAIEDAATIHCDVCNRDCCCDEELTKKLAELAYERNDKGCFVEPSERVREAAKSAMCACCPGQGPIDAAPAQPAPPDETIPTPMPPEANPDADRNARRLPPTGPNVISAARVREARTKAMLPHGDAAVSDAVETEEIVTVDFGNGPQNRGRSPVVSSTRRTTTPAVTPKTTPASTRTRKSSVDAPAGPSSRRAAVERGLAAPAAGQRTAQLQQPAGVTGKWQPAAADVRVSDGAPREQVSGERVAYRAVSLAPKAGPPAVPGPAITAAAERTSIRGKVARISKDAGTVEVRLENSSDQLHAGDRLKLSHNYLLEADSFIGYLEVISAGPRGVTTKPVGNLRLEQITRGDEATLHVTRTADTRSQAATSVRRPDVNAEAMAAR